MEKFEGMFFFKIAEFSTILRENEEKVQNLVEINSKNIFFKARCNSFEVRPNAFDFLQKPRHNIIAIPRGAQQRIRG